MLLNLHKKSWMEGLTLQDYSEHCKLNETIVKEMLELAKNYNKVQLWDFIQLFKRLKWPSKQHKRCASLHNYSKLDLKWSCIF